MQKLVVRKKKNKQYSWGFIYQKFNIMRRVQNLNKLTYTNAILDSEPHYLLVMSN